MEDFRGDYEQLAAVMRASWGEGPSAPYLFSAELLADVFRYPGASFSLAPTVYSGAELIAFAAGLPRQVRLAGARRRILIATLVTVARGHKARGYGTLIWNELLRRASAAGYDGVVTYCADGRAMQRIIERHGRQAGVPQVHLKTFSYLIGVAPRSTNDATTGASAPELVDAAAQVRGHHLCRVWSAAEAEWQLSRLGSVAVSAGGGVLTGSVVTVDDPARSRYLVIDDVLWGSLAGEARQALLGQLLGSAVSQGAGYAVAPLLGYADLRPFLAAGLQPTPHTMHAYLTMWSDRAALHPAESFYLDVI